MREDLGALFARITRQLIELERPLLDAHGLSMWGYIALSRLATGPAETQLALAAAIGHDKTRLIAVLDTLERDGLITREPDPRDRRARLVRITPAGAQRHAAAVPPSARWRTSCCARSPPTSARRSRGPPTARPASFLTVS